jgi:hypothetical protein
MSTVPDTLPNTDYEKQEYLDEKYDLKKVDVVDAVEENEFAVLESEQDFATQIISVHDDPTLNPWTVRAFIIGLGLSVFGGVLGTFSKYFIAFSMYLSM